MRAQHERRRFVGGGASLNMPFASDVQSVRDVHVDISRESHQAFRIVKSKRDGVLVVGEYSPRSPTPAVGAAMEGAKTVVVI